MITIDGLEAAPHRLRGAFLTIGNFDGVHRGHRRLIRRLKDQAKQAGVPAAALTFDPHPIAVLRPEGAPRPLTRLERKAELLVEAGADEVGLFATGPWLLNLTAREFYERVIRGLLDAAGLVEGPTFGFGRDRAGDVATLAAWCAEDRLPFETVEPIELEGQIVSSSLIRRAIAEGRAEQAEAMLGRPHRISGLVVPGAGRGRALGFPTANLDGVPEVLPADGVYAAFAWLEDRDAPFLAAAHIGRNATFGAEVRSIEAHLLDFDANLTGRNLALDLIAHVRPTRRFSGPDELVAQIGRDVERIRRVAALRGGKDRSPHA